MFLLFKGAKSKSSDPVVILSIDDNRYFDKYATKDHFSRNNQKKIASVLQLWIFKNLQCTFSITGCI